MLGGEPMPRAMIAAWAAAVPLYNLYGVTEATVCLIHILKRKCGDANVPPLPSLVFLPLTKDARHIVAVGETKG